MQSLITPNMVASEYRLPLSGLKATIEQGRSLAGGQLWTATIWRRKKRPVVVVAGSEGELVGMVGKADRLYAPKARIR